MRDELTYAPRRIEWRAPEGWTVWADEDGVHLRSVSGDLMEQPDVLNLIKLYEAVRAQIANDRIYRPEAPTQAQLRAMEPSQRAAHFSRIAARAVAEAINPTTVPF